MAYKDTVGNFTFEIRPGDDWRGPEQYTYKCPGCNKVIAGKIHNRSILKIASDHGWFYLCLDKNTILYCSGACLRAHDPEIEKKIWGWFLDRSSEHNKLFNYLNANFPSQHGSQKEEAGSETDNHIEATEG